MTGIVQGFKTKKAFKEHVEAGKDFRVEDPSPFNVATFTRSSLAKKLLDENRTFAVTNHPKRSWFAEIYFDRVNATLKVK